MTPFLTTLIFILLYEGTIVIDAIKDSKYAKNRANLLFMLRNNMTGFNSFNDNILKLTSLQHFWEAALRGVIISLLAWAKYGTITLVSISFAGLLAAVYWIQFDPIFNIICFWPDDKRKFLDKLKASLKQFLFVGTTGAIDKFYNRKFGHNAGKYMLISKAILLVATLTAWLLLR